MTNLLYPKYKEAIVAGTTLTLSSAAVKVCLVDTGAYTYASTHANLSDVPAAARIHISPALGSKTFTDGVFDAADTTLTAATGVQSEALVIYRSGTTSVSSQLVAYIDSGSGLPVTPDGTDIVITWNASGIFAI